MKILNKRAVKPAVSCLIEAVTGSLCVAQRRADLLFDSRTVNAVEIVVKCDITIVKTLD